MKKKIFITGLVLFVFLAGCGNSAEGSYSTAYPNEYNLLNAENKSDGIYEASDYAVEQEINTDNSSANNNVRDGRKLIRTANLSVETLEFDSLLSYVENRTNEYGGYIENLNVYNSGSNDYYDYSESRYNSQDRRYANLTIRVPKDKLDSFLGEVAEKSNITSRSESEEDVTLSYIDLESHKKVLLAEQERLLTFLEQAETIEDMITIESRLSDIRYEIESMESSLRTYDNQIEYSTVYLNISEVVVLTPVETQEKTVWERISEGFVHSLQSIGEGFNEFFVGFVIFLPYILLFAVVVLIILGVVFASIKRGEKKRKSKAAKQNMYAAQMNYPINQGQPMPPMQQNVPNQNTPNQNVSNTQNRGN